MKRILLSLLLLTLLPLSSARASEGAGARSLFALGSDARSLGMGGATAAFSSDAASPMWNPAGLAGVTHFSMIASHSALLGDGFSEQQISLAQPSWRWGTLGIGMRRFGVDGIVGRDDRNFDVGEFSDQQSEFLLSWGRGLSEGLALGATFKARQHSLAGKNASGMGADIGLAYRIPNGSGLGFGLALRNVLEPSLRLDEENVVDPTALRLGVGLERNLGSRTLLRVATDLERTREHDPQWHAGAELNLLGLLALRGGMHDGAPRAGVSVQWKDLQVDYAWQSEELASVHHFGVGANFGPSRDERRRRSFARREAEMQKRLEAAFSARENARLAQLLTASELALQNGHHDEALEMVATIEVLRPDHSGLGALRRDAWRGKARDHEDQDEMSMATVAWARALEADPDDRIAEASLARLKAKREQEASLATEVQARFESALASFAAGNLPAARDGMAAVLELAPGNEAAIALAARIAAELESAAMDSREAFASLLRRGQLTRAKAELDRLEALVGSPDPALEARWMEANQRAESPSEPANVAKVSREASPNEPNRKAELADLYARGQRAAEADRPGEALHYFGLVWTIDADYGEAADYLKREYTLRGMEAFSERRYSEAVAAWEEALRIDPEDHRTRGYLDRALERQRRDDQEAR